MSISADSHEISVLFADDIFSPETVEDERAERLMRAAVDRSRELVRPSDFVAAAIRSEDGRLLAPLGQSLDSGVLPADLAELIEVYNPPRTGGSRFDGRRESFSPGALRALAEFSRKLVETPRVRPVAAESLMASMIKHLDSEERGWLTIIHLDRAEQLFSQQVEFACAETDSLFDPETHLLRSQYFTEAAMNLLLIAADRAVELGFERVLPPHFLLAALSETEGVAEHIVRLQAQPEVGPGKVAEVVSQTLRLGERKADSIELSQVTLEGSGEEFLDAARRTARLWGSDEIDTAHLLLALVENPPERLKAALERAPINLNLEKMRTHLEQYLREAKTKVRREVSFRLPASLLPSEDLTYRARTEDLIPALHIDGYFDVLLRGLYRRKNHNILVTGLRGVGKTTLLRELARRAAKGGVPFLRRKRFLWVDCRDVSPQDSRSKLTAILSQIAGRSDLIVCLDGLGGLLRGESGANHKLPLRAALKEGRVHMIGVLSDWDYEDLFSADHELLEYFTRVQIKEPAVPQALEIVTDVAAGLANTFRVTIGARAINRAVLLSADYILNDRLPTKAIKILHRVCEDLDFERTQREESTKKQKTATSLEDKLPEVTAEEVIRVISEISGIPVETLSGTGQKAEYERDLGDFVIGQPEAVKEVATQLRLIKAGLNDPGKPAAVMLFAGLTGVGKTELAKALARFYSASKRLQTYTMANFSEPHSISGIIGVPPGYVGHEQGGRLINDLSSDPYCVFLMDESEKAHPEVWKPFLNLFDEGWIVDQRGVKASADRAIFILTSNAGAEEIGRMHKAGNSMEEIIEKVREILPTVKDSKTNQAVFTPEFLARIKRILIFNPLDEKAMEGICRKTVGQMQATWRDKREKTLIVPDALYTYVAKKSAELDAKSGHKEGGRVVRKLLTDLLDTNIQSNAANREDEFKVSDTIKVNFTPPEGAVGPLRGTHPIVEIEFLTTKAKEPSECLADLVSLLEQGSADPSQELLLRCLKWFEHDLSRWAAEHPNEKPTLGDTLEFLRVATKDFDRNVKETALGNQRFIADLVQTLKRGQGAYT